MKLAIDINDVYRDFSYQFMQCYKRGVDDTCEITEEEITSANLDEVFQFDTRDEYLEFRYRDYAYEIYGRSECVDQFIRSNLNMWVETTLQNLDEENVPEIMMFSAFEYDTTIQATYAFLAANPLKIRELYMPIDSSDIFKKCDVLITANPELIANAPSDKIVIKIEKPYNADIYCKYSFKTMNDLINDENETVIKILSCKNE